MKNNLQNIGQAYVTAKKLAEQLDTARAELREKQRQFVSPIREEERRRARLCGLTPKHVAEMRAEAFSDANNQAVRLERQLINQKQQLGCLMEQYRQVKG